MGTTSTRISRHMNAPRTTIYRALLDSGAVAKWMVPSGMSSLVHAFDAPVGGSFRVSLTYDAPTRNQLVLRPVVPIRSSTRVNVVGKTEPINKPVTAQRIYE